MFVAYAVSPLVVLAVWVPHFGDDFMRPAAVGRAMLMTLAGPLAFGLLNNDSWPAVVGAALMTWWIWLTLVVLTPLRNIHPGLHAAMGLFWCLTGCPAAASMFT